MFIKILFLCILSYLTIIRSLEEENIKVILFSAKTLPIETNCKVCIRLTNPQCHELFVSLDNEILIFPINSETINTIINNDNNDSINFNFQCSLNLNRKEMKTSSKYNQYEINQGKLEIPKLSLINNNSEKPWVNIFQFITNTYVSNQVDVMEFNEDDNQEDILNMLHPKQKLKSGENPKLIKLEDIGKNSKLQKDNSINSQQIPIFNPTPVIENEL
jgi:hypothetical protein